jgi:hypothetical protein
MPNPNIVVGAEPFGKVLHAHNYVAGATINPGDLVKMDANGVIVLAAAGATTGVLGVALSRAIATQEVLVSDDPDQEYVMQVNDASVAAQTNLGLNYDLIDAGGNTTFKRSGMQVNGASGAITATLPLRAIRLHTVSNNAFGTNAKIVVKINNNQRGNASVGL